MLTEIHIESCDQALSSTLKSTQIIITENGGNYEPMIVTMSTAMAMDRRRRFHGREGLLYIKNSREASWRSWHLSLKDFNK